jgi:excinuclease ABC subunit C
MDAKAFLPDLPTSSGVYLMKNTAGQVIYVGKAVNIRKRVASYFRGNLSDAKTQALVAHIATIDTVETASEAEALILEASLIKTFTPRFNIVLRDDKSYPYIEITGDDFPRISIQRPVERKPGARYYGPYVDAHLVREALQIIRKIFHFCTCSPTGGSPCGTMQKRPCLNYHIGLCDAPCAGHISKEDYQRNIRHIEMILKGEKDDLYRDLNREMETLAREQKYEEAAKVRDQLQAIGALYSSNKDVNYFKEAEQLQRALDLPRQPQRIETFDISNIMGTNAVGSMVSFFNGQPDKNNYRRFKIKTVEGIDDFKMIAEVVRRRYSRLQAEGAMYPDLILIDGGKGKLAAACEELKRLGVDIPIASLAKREEEVFLPRKRNPVILSKHSLGLKLLQRCRDEAHRFAVSYHRLLRSKNYS